MGGSVCRQVCKRQMESGDAVDVLADAAKCRGLQAVAPVELAVAKLPDIPPSPASTADETSVEAASAEFTMLALPEISEPTLASPEECERNTPVSEYLDAVPKRVEPCSEPIPPVTAKSLTEQESATEPPSDGVGDFPDEHPAVRPSTLQQQQQQQKNPPQPSLSEEVAKPPKEDQRRMTGITVAVEAPGAEEDGLVAMQQTAKEKGLPSIAAVVHAQAFAKALNEARLKKKISPSQLAQRIGRKAADVRNFESGAVVPSDAILTKMSRILNTELPQVDKGTSNMLPAAVSTEASDAPETALPAESLGKQGSQARKNKGRGKRRN